MSGVSVQHLAKCLTRINPGFSASRHLDAFLAKSSFLFYILFKQALLFLALVEGTLHNLHAGKSWTETGGNAVDQLNVCNLPEQF
jgi:hypothetical protein